MTALALILGVFLACVFVRLARRYPAEGERRLYAVGLVVAALVYVIFGVVGGAGAQRLALESLGVVIYGVAAWAGFRGRHWVLKVGWALHVVWDVALHLRGAGVEYTPPWYPWSCVGFDLVIAVAIVADK